MAVPVVNLAIEQGTDFTRTFSLKRSDGAPLNLTNYNFDVKMRKWSGSAGYISFATTYNADPTQGKLTISLSNTQTGIITSGRYNYDIIVINHNLSDVKTKVITGQIIVNPTVS
jgi:hypothetical protein